MAFAILECETRSGRCDKEDEFGGGREDDFHIFDMDFFDEQSLVIVYQSYAEEGTVSVYLIISFTTGTLFACGKNVADDD